MQIVLFRTVMLPQKRNCLTLNFCASVCMGLDFIELFGQIQQRGYACMDHYIKYA